MYRHFFKRTIDIIISIFAIVILSPIFFIITLILLFLNKGSGVFFTQIRPGKDNVHFKLIKFKSMTDEKDKNGNILPDISRLTNFGKFIRRTSLDELPQLINVLTGDMSLIGPRPLMDAYIPLYNKTQARRTEIRPGITGWAQCNGRNSISWKQKFEYDIWYVDHVSFFLDMKILYLTIIKLVKKEGIYFGNSIDTMAPFNGNN